MAVPLTFPLAVGEKEEETRGEGIYLVKDADFLLPSLSHHELGPWLTAFVDSLPRWLQLGWPGFAPTRGEISSTEIYALTMVEEGKGVGDLQVSFRVPVPFFLPPLNFPPHPTSGSMLRPRETLSTTDVEFCRHFRVFVEMTS